MARNDIDLTTVAKAIADPSRASMLLRLMDGQAHTAGSLATAAGTSASATTAHLHHLRDAGLVEVEAAGRQRLHRLSSAAVAHAIEALAEISPPAARIRLQPSRTPGHQDQTPLCPHLL